MTKDEMIDASWDFPLRARYMGVVERDTTVIGLIETLAGELRCVCEGPPDKFEVLSPHVLVLHPYERETFTLKARNSCAQL